MWVLANQGGSYGAIVGALIMAEVIAAPVSPMVDSIVVMACEQVRVANVVDWVIAATIYLQETATPRGRLALSTCVLPLRSECNMHC